MKLTNQVPERNRAVFDIFTICIDKYMLPPQTWKPLLPGRTSATCRKIWRKPKAPQLQPRQRYYVRKVINAAGKYQLLLNLSFSCFNFNAELKKKTNKKLKVFLGDLLVVI